AGLRQVDDLAAGGVLVDVAGLLVPGHHAYLADRHVLDLEGAVVAGDGDERVVEHPDRRVHPRVDAATEADRRVGRLEVLDVDEAGPGGDGHVVAGVLGRAVAPLGVVADRRRVVYLEVLPGRLLVVAGVVVLGDDVQGVGQEGAVRLVDLLHPLALGRDDAGVLVVQGEEGLRLGPEHDEDVADSVAWPEPPGLLLLLDGLGGVAQADARVGRRVLFHLRLERFRVGSGVRPAAGEADAALEDALAVVDGGRLAAALAAAAAADVKVVLF